MPKSCLKTRGIALLLTCLPLWPPNALQAGPTARSISFEFAGLSVPIAGVAGGTDVVLIGEPVNGKVVVLSRFTGEQIGGLPPPPNDRGRPHPREDQRLCQRRAAGDVPTAVP